MAQILLADGTTDPVEMNLLNKIAQCYDMSEIQVKAIINSLKAGLVYIPAPADNRESWTLLQAAARMALVDDKISPSEERELILLAQHLGYSTADVTRAVRAEEKRRFAEQREEQQRVAREKMHAEALQKAALEKADEEEDKDGENQ
ncbi:MAG: hypothetical protein ACD_39C01295G0001 [uncultured bacterium]|nr:MAG: hypothetical protein ACD_39C01295G0001 [uncultured bacterium]